MNICRYLFLTICFILPFTPLVYPFMPKAYISSSNLQDDICSIFFRMKFPDIDDNDGYYINDDNNHLGPREMINVLKRMIKICPYNYGYYEKLALIYDYIGDYDNELKILKAMLRHIPKNSKDKDVDYGNLGRAYLITGNIDKARYWLNKANKINPGNIINRQNYLICCILKKDFKEAAKELKAIDKLNGDDKDLYFDTWQYCTEEIKDEKQIIEFFQIACAENPNSFKAHRALGIAIRASSDADYEKNMPLAVKEFKKALKLGPKYIPTYISMGDTYLLLALIKKEKKPFKEAKEWFDKAYKIDPANIHLAYAMGEYFLYVGDYDKAIEKLEYAYSRNPENENTRDELAIAYNQKAYSLYKAGKHLGYGIKLIDKAIRLKPDDGIILSTKAELLYKIGKYEEAYKYIKKGLRLAPDKKEIKQDLKMIKDALNKREGALSLSTK